MHGYVRNMVIELELLLILPFDTPYPRRDNSFQEIAQ